MAKPTIVDGKVIVANIPMCDDQGCPSRFNCYRHGQGGRLAVANKQPYFAEPTRARDEESCAFFWPVNPKGVRRPRIRRITVEEQYTIRNDPAQIKAFISARDVAKMLDIAPATLEGWLRRPDLNFPPPLKMGKNRMWTRAEIAEFLKSDHLRGIGARGRHAWLGATKESPAYPWVHTVQAEPK